ncbi:Rpn family recombination-promoting nuclease/putative transposase [Halomonas sabkhae]|uniref:Rpn family recombination-promoting nuclease/putative transposase n=1 Tax=Halomonas sabkhae TaxID=626223 RepID=UPI0025B33049|nr:Rpn family recombination-promoting nuclease/putative transposase [Halomonas sabkhae]MDN3525296.1 Rpn family recombination-promoting nuclease/putative transposase [Halomonas sabkhae]
MADHDNSYKRLFSEPAMVRDLLTEFVQEEWVDQLDLDTLEKVSGSYVSDDLRDREDDIIWRVRWGEGWLYVYLLIEFQRTVDRYMAVRVMAYEALLYQDLIRQKAFTPAGKLPPVLPIVLYNGDQRWTAAQNVADLVEPIPGGLSHYRPSLPYLLLDEAEICQNEDHLEETRNLVGALFQLEHGQDLAQWETVLKRLTEWLQAPEHASLRRAFTVWVTRVLIPSRWPGFDPDEISALQDLQEVHAMLAERIREWPERFKQEGIEVGEERRAVQTARNLIADTSLPDEQIANATGLSLAHVQELRREVDSGTS